MAWYEELFASKDPARVDIDTDCNIHCNQVDFVINCLDLDNNAQALDPRRGNDGYLADVAERGYDVVGLDLNEYAFEKRNGAATGSVDRVLAGVDLFEIGPMRQ